MRIVIVVHGTLPVIRYGGTQRVMWDLGRALTRLGHSVCFFADKVGGNCTFAEVRQHRYDIPLAGQLPEGTDIVHFNDHVYDLDGEDIPHVLTVNGNEPVLPLDPNTIFVSRNHANRHGSQSYVYNGLDWEHLPHIAFFEPRHGYHFLGKAAWSVKNVRGAISVVRSLSGEQLTVLGGYRLNLKMGFRLTLSPRVHFRGMVDDAEKYAVMQRSRGLIFPVTWHEPFGLAVIESLYAGCPVFATPYGSLPELVNGPSLGYLTSSATDMVEHLKGVTSYDARICHEYARDMFSADVMAQNYIKKYEQALNGEVLNPTFGKQEPLFRNLPWNK